MDIKGTKVLGVNVDEETRCKHYHTDKDIIAIKFKCCNTYYPCYECHQEIAEHEAKVWGKDQQNERAILCGACGHELSIKDYMGCDYTCPSCQSHFNPACQRHYDLYFQTS
ncbi:putative CHY-type Zn-finger protein [Scopulibacillus darangshiensis]|uniref:Putative CHY-type Zn-finger protein n=1 Tax=Scopulibacillus darangshiensis TaxID=442528 RepID=A0A4R2P7J4_9BACL|nr:CHY zinc finger protein [Scopulibacillus darangshiensis]TCP29795.1 putative CHY-type Zn-finger protein [Scopulibacillus darangshiensis]